MVDYETPLPDLLEQGYEAVRSFNHRTMNRAIIAPEAYRILGEAAAMVGCLPQAFDQIAGGLRQALREYDVYDQNRDPADSIEIAVAEMAAATRLFRDAYTHLSAAQTAINYQGINEDESGNLRRRPSLRAAPDPPE
jgi:hypothetical protein